MPLLGPFGPNRMKNVRFCAWSLPAVSKERPNESSEPIFSIRKERYVDPVCQSRLTTMIFSTVAVEGTDQIRCQSIMSLGTGSHIRIEALKRFQCD